MAFGTSRKTSSRAQRASNSGVVRRSGGLKAVVGRVVVGVLGLVACAIPPFFVNNIMGYLPLLAYVLIVVISFVYLRILAKSLVYSEDSLAPSCERGSDIDFVVKFENRSPLVFLRLEPCFYISDLFGEVDVEIPASMTLMPFEKRDFHFAGNFTHIGAYHAGVNKIVISDLLGLFQHTVINDNRHTVEVLPRLFDVSRIDLANVSSLDSQKAFKPLVTEDMDYAGVRDYELGDPLKTIHWDLSARTPDANYLTRLFETFTNPGVDIIIDTSSPEYDHESLMEVFDGLVESALSVNEYAHRVGVDSALRYIRKDGEEGQMRILKVEDFESLVSVIPRINVGNGQQTLSILRREGNSIHGQSNLAYVTSHLNEGIVDTLIDIKLRKRNPLLFLVIPHSLEEKERSVFTGSLNRLDAAGIVYYAISSAGELTEEEQ